MVQFEPAEGCGVCDAGSCIAHLRDKSKPQNWEKVTESGKNVTENGKKELKNGNGAD